MIRPQTHIAAMAPYALARLDRGSGIPLVSLSQNESIRPPSPDVAQAVAAAVGGAQLYPDPEWRELRAALSAVHDIAPEGLLCSNGSMELIRALAEGFAGPAAAVLAPAHAYPFFRTAAALVQARFDVAPERDGSVCVDALLQAVRPDTRLVFLANPGNPTGTRLPLAELGRLRDGLPPEILLVLDEAYGEFADHLAEPAFHLVARGDTVVLRTFSKAYGLAGLRVGWGLFPPQIAQEMRKILTPNAVCGAGQAAARAALEDQTYMRQTCALTAQIRDRFIDRLRTAGFDLPRSLTNFALLRLSSVAAAQTADAALRAGGIIARAQGGAGLPHALRITVGPEAQMARAAEVLERWAGEAS